MNDGSYSSQVPLLASTNAWNFSMAGLYSSDSEPAKSFLSVHALKGQKITASIVTISLTDYNVTAANASNMYTEYFDCELN